MDAFMKSSTTTTPAVPTIEMGHASRISELGSHHYRAHSESNSRITSYDNLVRFDPFDIDFIGGPPALPAVPTVEMGQASGTRQLGSPHYRAHCYSNSRITSYDDLARFDPFDTDFIGGPPVPPPLPDIPVDPIASTESPIPVAFSSEAEVSYLNSGPSMALGSPEDHIESFNMDFDLLREYIEDEEGFAGAVETPGGNDVVPVNPVVHQEKGVCMDGSTNVSIEAEPSIGNNEVVKKAMPLEKLIELATIDPKRAKRILSNRQSAARSKERKTQSTMEVEKKVQKLEAESAEISVKLVKMEKENEDIEAKKKEILYEIESMDKDAKVKEELNEVLRDKLRELKKEYKQKFTSKRHNFGGLVSQFSSQLAMYQMSHFRTWQAQQQQQPPSHSDQSQNAHRDLEDSSFDSQKEV